MARNNRGVKEDADAKRGDEDVVIKARQFV